ncbi:hypothetical protein DGG96_20230 [Legionella qingyii]|uniref:Uncharacterized protein n=1 Tax=Legionella qingyii TaxID=2184757 RepID=A0A317TXX5_9GAMM|nr:hypothetical protein DGG96_20230 [Legionella qingyii]
MNISIISITFNKCSQRAIFNVILGKHTVTAMEFVMKLYYSFERNQTITLNSFKSKHKKIQ